MKSLLVKLLDTLHIIAQVRHDYRTQHGRWDC